MLVPLLQNNVLEGAPGAYTLAADTGLYVLGGQAVNLTCQRRISADYAPYTLTGVAAAFQFGHRIQPTTGLYALTGQSAGLIYSGAISVGYIPKTSTRAVTHPLTTRPV